ncbi:uncharacterized protein RHO17_011354 isoform 1-T1 [Thomomys bottae]
MDIIIIYNDICHCTDFHWSSQKFLGKVEISQQLFFSQEIHRWPAFVMLEVKQMENRKVLQQNARSGGPDHLSLSNLGRTAWKATPISNSAPTPGAQQHLAFNLPW